MQGQSDLSHLLFERETWFWPRFVLCICTTQHDRVHFRTCVLSEPLPRWTRALSEFPPRRTRILSEPPPRRTVCTEWTATKGRGACVLDTHIVQKKCVFYTILVYYVHFIFLVKATSNALSIFNICPSKCIYLSAYPSVRSSSNPTIYSVCLSIYPFI